MPEHKRFIVSDYMRKKIVTIPETATFRDAVASMMKNQANGLVVTDERQKIIGILSVLDLIAFIVPDYLEADKHLASFEAEDVFQRRAQEVQNISVAEFMTRHIHTVGERKPIIEAATLMSEFRIRQLPVVDDAGALVGYISRTEVKRAIGDVLGILTE